MSSKYVGDHGDGASSRVSASSIGQAVQEKQAQTADSSKGSTASSTTSSLSGCSSRHDDLDLDLDLDSLFKRLDKYTAEMQEVEDRLKRARRNSKKPDGVYIKRFSFEFSDAPEHANASTPPGSSRASSSTLQQRRTPTDGLEVDEDSAAVHFSRDSHSSRRSSRIDSRHISICRPRSAVSSVAFITDARGEALAALHEHRQPQEEHDELDGPQDLFRDWKVWAERQFPAAEPTPTRDRSSSRYSRSADPFEGAPNNKFFWKRMSPPPPLKDIRRTPTFRKARVSDAVTTHNREGGQDYEEYFSEEDEPGPSVPTSWSLPPRSSSKRVISNESLATRSSRKSVMNVAGGQEQESEASRPATHRRMITGDGRSSVRDGGFWFDQSRGLFGEEEVPPVPALSASNSNATLSPPLTPLNVGDPREDQLRRELETFSIQDGVEALEHRYKRRRPPMLNLVDSDGEKDDLTPMPTPFEQEYSDSVYDDGERNLRPRTRRSKSIFSIFQRRSPVEKLIDMYFDDEPEEKPILKRRSTWSRKGSPIQEKMPKSPAIPPQYQLHGKQTSV